MLEQYFDLESPLHIGELQASSPSTPLRDSLPVENLIPSCSQAIMANVASVPDEPGQPPALTAPALAAQSTAREQIITPFDVSGGVDETGKAVAIDYDKIVDTFGSRRIDAALLKRFEEVTGKKPHRLLRRGMVFSHRDLTSILDRFEKQKNETDPAKKETPFFLYTGRGPSSSSMHVGHTIPFEFTK